MEITDVRIRRLNMPEQGKDGDANEGSAGSFAGGRMRAVVSVTFDGEFVVHDIKVIQGDQSCFIAMPSRKVEDGVYKDIAHPIKPSLRTKLQEAILEKYEEAFQNAIRENGSVKSAGFDGDKSAGFDGNKSAGAADGE